MLGYRCHESEVGKIDAGIMEPGDGRTLAFTVAGPLSWALVITGWNILWHFIRYR
jgi:hypothetical protein